MRWIRLSLTALLLLTGLGLVACSDKSESPVAPNAVMDKSSNPPMLALNQAFLNDLYDCFPVLPDGQWAWPAYMLTELFKEGDGYAIYPSHWNGRSLKIVANDPNQSLEGLIVQVPPAGAAAFPGNATLVRTFYLDPDKRREVDFRLDTNQGPQYDESVVGTSYMTFQLLAPVLGWCDMRSMEIRSTKQTPGEDTRFNLLLPLLGEKPPIEDYILLPDPEEAPAPGDPWPPEDPDPEN